jgi:multidrug efflux pump subunit AcrB
MRSNNQVIDPHLDWNEQTPSLKLVVDQDRVRALGMTPQDISKSLSMLLTGVPITTVRDGIEKVEVIARAVPGERLDLAHIGDLSLYSAASSFWRRSPRSNTPEAILWRINRDMVTVRADVVDLQPRT